jgi:hypothetical protein
MLRMIYLKVNEPTVLIFVLISLALHTNMSLRNLERKFTEQVDVSPKMYARFKRFHHAPGLMKTLPGSSFKKYFSRVRSLRPCAFFQSISNVRSATAFLLFQS